MYEALISHLRECAKLDPAENTFSEAADAIADLQRRKRGKWILHKDGSATCSECHYWQNSIWDLDNQQNFCGVCGADMRGE